MTGERKIRIKIDPLGNPVIEADGFAGGDCTEATRGLEEALAGSGAGERDLKAEYYDVEDETEGQQNKIGW